MSYVEQSLSSGEQVVLHGKVHWAVAFRWFALAVLFLLVPNVRALAVPFLVVGGTVLALTRAMNEYAVTSKRVIIKAGILSRQTLELNLSKVESIGVDQSILGRLLGYGHIRVRGTGGSQGHYKFVAAPLAFRKAVNEATEQLQLPVASVAPALAARG